MKTTFKEYDKLFKRLGKNLLILRTDKGLTQAKLGELIGYSGSAVSRIENMWRNYHATTDFILAICDFFDVTLEELLDKPSKKTYKKALKKSAKIEEKERENNIIDITDIDELKCASK